MRRLPFVAAGPDGYDFAMTPITPTTYLGQRFADYQDNWGAGWPAADHADATACRDLEERLAYGLHLYQLIQDQYQAVRASLLASGKAYDLPAAKYIEQLMALWVAPAAAAIKRLDAVEGNGCRIERAAAFRDAVLDVRVSLSIPVERAAAQAEEYARDGMPRGRTTEELRRELRHRMGA